MVASPPSLFTVVGEMSATMTTPGMSLKVSRIAVKRGARNCRLSWVSNTTFALPARRERICTAAASASTLPVRYCGALSSETAGGGTTVPT